MKAYIKAACHTTLLIIGFSLSDLHAVSIRAHGTAISYTSDPSVTLPCKYVTDHIDPEVVIKWWFGKQKVLVKNSSGKVSIADRYKGRAQLGNGCSLILYKPRVNDSGLYTARVIATGDKKGSDKAIVNLDVRIGSIPEETGQPNLQPPMNVTNSIDSKLSDIEKEYSKILWIAFSSVTALGIFALIFQIAFIRLHIQRYLQGVRQYVLTGIPFLLLLFGFFMQVVGIMLRDWIPSLVSVPCIALSVVIQIGTMFYVWYRWNFNVIDEA